MESLFQDLRYSLRVLTHQPSLVAVAVLTLALGIGASTSIFTVLNAVVLRSLPYPDADRLAVLWVDFGEQGQSLPSMSPLDFRDLEQMSQQFEGFAAGAGRSVSLVGEGDPELVELGRVTHDFFPLLGAKPALGRGFLAEEEVLDGPAVVLLSHDLWMRRYAGDPEVIGKTVQVDGVTMEVVGVMPAGFRLYLPSEAFWLKDSDLWAPLRDPYTDPRNRTTFNVLGRLKPGVTFEQAQEEMASIAARLREEHPIHRLSDTRIRVVPLHQDVVKGVRSSLFVLSAAAVLVLLIACGNVANLMLARAADRDNELTVRVALGAGHGRLVRQILTESTLLALAGGALGLLLADWGVTFLLSLQPAHLPRLENVRIDGAALGFALASALSTVLIFGLAPAIRVSRSHRDSMPKHGGRSIVGDGRSPFRKLVIVAEVAISLALLIAGGLLIRSFSSLREVRPGFDAEGVLTFRLSLPRGRYPDSNARADFYDRLEDRLRALPGVRSVGAVSQIPLTGNGSQAPYAYDEETAEKWESVTADARTVTPGYFETLGIGLRAGRLFDSQDARNGRLVVIVDETLARKAWPGRDAVGQQIQLPIFRPEGLTREWVDVVGVVEHVRMIELSHDGREQVYFPHRERAQSRIDMVVAAAVDPGGLASQVRREVHALDKDLPVHALRPLAEVVGTALAQARFTVILVGVFATVALLLALVGLYSVISYAVGRRLRELGVRVALGAQTRDILGLVIGQGLTLTLVGILIGLLGSVAATRALSGLLYGVSATDPATFVGASLLVGAVALLACHVPARRATRVDPVTVLRES